jgi:hypothetical protein
MIKKARAKVHVAEDVRKTELATSFYAFLDSSHLLELSYFLRMLRAGSRHRVSFEKTQTSVQLLSPSNVTFQDRRCLPGLWRPLKYEQFCRSSGILKILLVEGCCFEYCIGTATLFCQSSPVLVPLFDDLLAQLNFETPKHALWTSHFLIPTS